MFIAIELSDLVRQHIARLSRSWRDHWDKNLLGWAREPHPSLSWVRPENLHVTLKFVGDISEDGVPSLCRGLREVAAGGSIALRPDRIECFPMHGPVRVVAMGLGGDVGRVHLLHRAIEERCALIGVKREGRDFRPHVTMGRGREVLRPHVRESLQQAAEAHLPGPEFVASEFVLMESRLEPEGAEYIPFARFPLDVQAASE